MVQIVNPPKAPVLADRNYRNIPATPPRSARRNSVEQASDRAENSRLRRWSVIRNGRKSSVSLETGYWEVLRQLAKQQNLPVAKLVQQIDVGPNRHNLSSALRLFVLNHFQSASKRGGPAATVVARRAPAKFVIFLIDDDRGVLAGLARLLQTAGYKTEAYSSAVAFLSHHNPSTPGCIVADLSMPGLNGLNLQQALAHQGEGRPIIFLTGHGSVEASVLAMKAGAIDFLVKPVKEVELFAAIDRAEERDRCVDAERRRVAALLRTLTSRETEVLAQLVAGRPNKQIAAALGITLKTTKVHRSHIMEKMGVKHIAKLVRMTTHVSFQQNY